MSFVSKAMTLKTYLPFRRMDSACADPARAQRRLWSQTWKEIGNSPFWREHMPMAAKGLPDLSRFPITTYEDYRGAVNQTVETGISQLADSAPVFFAMSGGSTGVYKVFPVTEPYLRQLQVTQLPFMHSLFRRFPRLLEKPVLYFASSLPDERSPTGIDMGFISGFNYRNVPALVRKNYALPLAVFQSGDTFQRWAGLYALATDISGMFAITPSSVTAMAEAILARLDEYWPILEGKVPAPTGYPAVNVSPERLALLRRALSGGRLRFKEVWPSLQFVCCWTAAASGVLVPKLKTFVGEDVPVVDAIYSATEGWMTVPMSSETPGGVVHPDAHVIEFWKLRPGREPVKEELVGMDQLEVGSSYEVFLTTKMGFVRYRLWDIVRCVGFRHKSPIIVFSRKTGNTIVLGPTWIEESNLASAMLAVNFQATGPHFFAPAPQSACVDFFCQTDDQVTRDSVARLESFMFEKFPDYQNARKIGLGPISIKVRPTDWPFWTSGRHAQTKPRIMVPHAPRE